MGGIEVIREKGRREVSWELEEGNWEVGDRGRKDKVGKRKWSG